MNIQVQKNGFGTPLNIDVAKRGPSPMDISVMKSGNLGGPLLVEVIQNGFPVHIEVTGGGRGSPSVGSDSRSVVEHSYSSSEQHVTSSWGQPVHRDLPTSHGLPAASPGFSVSRASAEASWSTTTSGVPLMPAKPRTLVQLEATLAQKQVLKPQYAGSEEGCWCCSAAAWRSLFGSAPRRTKKV